MSNAFKRFKFDEAMLKAIEDIGFAQPTLIQERVIPKVLKGENVVAQSETGSGKSHAFLLPLIYRVSAEKRHTQAVILTPTRELAKQLHAMTNEILKSFPAIRVQSFIGGTDFTRDEQKAGNAPHIVIGTPSRVKDLMSSGSLDIHHADNVVVDEADLMIDLGFLETVDKIATALGEDARLLVFSATIPERLRVFLKKYVGEVEPIYIEQQKNQPSIHYSLVPVKGNQKTKKVLDIVRDVTPYIGLIFANSRERADELFDYLNAEGVNAGLFHGGLNPRERTKEIKKIRSLHYEWIVASDLASRGLDIDGASHVINYDIPKEIEFFTHRVGRVGRGTYEGTAITLYTPDEEHQVNLIEKKGYHLKHEDLKGGELAPIKPRNKRAARQKRNTETEKNIETRVKKPKKVKPGYKKKRKEELETLKRQERRKYAKRNKKKRR
ncbi:DEAD/DEAH box helicase [Salinicoccus albus]|uniref:DEAD/DEAH box helicase n=1 Tax=Salinicoccus albus TaxID=418756 RepID=UPI0003778B6B|nr:DEAD/DEAH box helicase [Salinicoccus albus]